jgi:hypothetical protein
VRADEVLVREAVGVEVAALPGREDAPQVAHHREDVGLVDRAAHRDQIAEVRDRALAVTREAVDDLGCLPSAERGRPARIREVVERDHRLHALFVALGDHPPVVVERRTRELAVFGLDARPLDREAVSAEAVDAHERDVVHVEMEAVRAVAGGLHARTARCVLERPPIVVRVAALDLVRGRGHAPHETVGKGHAHGAERRLPPA